jgi:DNA-binding HxlR family transcriptional regulator
MIPVAKIKLPAAPARPSAARMVEDIVGCKWSLIVLGRIRAGVSRPGALETAIPGLSKKVLNERLRKLVRFGIVTRRSYAELPPRVEYRLTPFGRKFIALLDGVERLQRELDGAGGLRGARPGAFVRRGEGTVPGRRGLAKPDAG